MKNLSMVLMFRSIFKRSHNSLWLVGVILVYGFLVFFGITSSSLSNLSVDASSKPGLVLNAPQPVRSDEFLRSSPLTLADLNNGSGVSLLDAQNSTEIRAGSDDLPNTILKWSSPRYLLERGVKHSLDSDQAFSAIWWFPVLVLLIFLPIFLKKIGVSAQISIISTLLVLLSTSANWWSLWPIAIMAWPVAGAYLAIVGLELLVNKAGRRTTIKGYFYILFSLAFLLLSAFEYAPWSLLVNVFILAITIGHIYEANAVFPVGKSYFFAYIFALMALLAGKIILIQSSISVSLATVYPGARRVLDGGSWLSLFGGDLSWALQRSAPLSSNQSELASSNIELFLLVLAFVPFLYIFRSTLGRNLPLIFGTLILIPFFLWTVAPWPSAVSEINPLRFIPPDRIVQILGIPSIIVFSIFANVFRRSNIADSALENRIKKSLLGLVLTPIFILVIGSNRNFSSLFSPDVIPPKYIWGCAIGIIVAIYISLTVKNVWVAFSPILVLSALNVMWINPVVVGLGDLQNSKSAQLIQKLDRGGNQIWASDNFWADALLMSNGADLASGQQGSGPNIELYKVLDPKTQTIDSWNRGASYVSFIWLDSGGTEISSPSADQVRISINPCSQEVSTLEIKWIVSSRTLSGSCLSSRGDFLWMGTTYSVYENDFKSN